MSILRLRAPLFEKGSADFGGKAGKWLHLLAFHLQVVVVQLFVTES